MCKTAMCTAKVYSLIFSDGEKAGLIWVCDGKNCSLFHNVFTQSKVSYSPPGFSNLFYGHFVLFHLFGQKILAKLVFDFFLSLSQTSPGFYVSAVKVF